MKSLFKIYQTLLLEQASVGDLLESITKRTLIDIDYSGDGQLPAGRRIIEPYLLGTTIAGNLGIRAYQREGVTKTFSPGWKIFLVNKIKTLKRLDENFEPRTDYNQYGDALFKSVERAI